MVRRSPTLMAHAIATLRWPLAHLAVSNARQSPSPRPTGSPTQCADLFACPTDVVPGVSVGGDKKRSAHGQRRTRADEQATSHALEPAPPSEFLRRLHTPAQWIRESSS